MMLAMILSMACTCYAMAQQAEITYDNVDQQGMRTISTRVYIDWGTPRDSSTQSPTIGLAISGITVNGETDFIPKLTMSFLNDAPFMFIANGAMLIKLSDETVIELKNGFGGVESEELKTGIGTIYRNYLMVNITPEQIKAISEKGIVKIRSELQGTLHGKNYIEREYSTPRFKNILQEQYDLIKARLATKSSDIREGF